MYKTYLITNSEGIAIRLKTWSREAAIEWYKNSKYYLEAAYYAITEES